MIAQCAAGRAPTARRGIGARVITAGVSETRRLLDRARAGDREAFDDLYRRHRGRLLAFVASRMPPGLGGFVAPEDLVQEAHLESARRLDEFEDRGPASFYRWLVAIAHNKIREASRRRGAKKRAHGALDAEPPAVQTSPSGRVMRDERSAQIAAALAGLPEAQAEAVRLRYLGGLSIAETAERLARSDAAVKALVARGLQALAERLAGSGGDPARPPDREPPSVG